MYKELVQYIGGLKESLFPTRSLRQMVHSVGRGFSFIHVLPRSEIDYEQDIGDGTRSSSVMAPIQFMQRTFPESPLYICNKLPGSEDIIYEHRLLDLVCSPNPFYDGNQLWMS